MCACTPQTTMEMYLNLWDLERLVRQYVGFNELLIKEYHARFKLYKYHDAFFLKAPNSNHTFLMQWRTKSIVRDGGLKYIYTFHHLIRPIKDKDYCDAISRPPVCFEDNAYRASILRYILLIILVRYVAYR